MSLTMAEKRAVTKQVYERYRRSTKKEKGAILDEFCRITGYNRAYAARLLKAGPPPGPARGPHTSRRAKVYDADVFLALKKIWATLDGCCGKRLAPVMPRTVASMEHFGELMLSAGVKAKLLSLSAATIDRMLAGERASLTLTGSSGTKPGTLLKHQIPIKTFADWDQSKPGFVEIDLVSHDGGFPRGEYCQTLDVTDVTTGWTETRAVRNKARVHVLAALQQIVSSLPFPVRGIDSDNGSEFINGHLVDFCVKRKITFTRSRPYKKNDGCYVEQKNWSVVRRNVGYARFDTPEELEILNKLYLVMRDHTNFFMPSVKLISKTRVGAKVIKRYDTPQTPYDRALASPEISEAVKSKLTKRYEKLNPVALKRTISTLQEQLYKCTAMKESIRRREVQTPDFEYIPDESTNQGFKHISP